VITVVQKKGCIQCSFINELYYYKNTENPYKLGTNCVNKNNLFYKYKLGTQHDADEILIKLLSSIENTNYSIMSEFETTYKCNSCGEFSIKKPPSDPIIYLSINESINSVQSAVDYYTMPSVCGWTCSRKCNNSIQLYKCTKINNILIFSLKAYKLSNNGNIALKNLTKFSVNPTIRVTVNDKIQELYLYSIIVHCGKAAIEGHYINISWSSLDKFILYNDNYVKNINESTILDERYDYFTPYVIFYTTTIPQNIQQFVYQFDIMAKTITKKKN